MAFCSSYPIRFSIEGKRYVLLVLFVALAWWWRNQGRLVPYAIAVALASLTHFYGFFDLGCWGLGRLAQSLGFAAVWQLGGDSRTGLDGLCLGLSLQFQGRQLDWRSKLCVAGGHLGPWAWRLAPAQVGLAVAHACHPLSLVWSEDSALVRCLPVR